jgi:type IV secretory pathway TrbL component
MTIYMTKFQNNRSVSLALTAIVVCLAAVGASLVFASPACAQVSNVAMAELYNSIMDACEGWLVKAGEIALQLLAVTAVIGFAIGIKDLVVSGQTTMDGIVALLVRYAFIVGLLVWLLNAPQRLALIPMSIKKIGSTISGQDISFSGLIDLFSDVTNPLVEFTNGLGWMDVGLIICMTFLIFLINCLFFMIASTVLVVEIEAVFILIGGLFTASFFVIGYFRDTFLSYIKALAAVGVKMLMLCLCLGIMRNIMAGWPALISAQLDNAESVFSFLMPMACALLGFYMILKAVPQFASSIMTGGVSGMDGGIVKAAAAAGYGLGMTIFNTSRVGAHGVTGAAGAVTQAAQAYSYTSQAAKDTGASSGEARRAGAWEAFKAVMTGPHPGASRSGGEQIYSDYQRGQQFADVRSGGDSNSLGSPPAASSAGAVAASNPAGTGNISDSSKNTTSTTNTTGTSDGRISSAGPYSAPSSQSSAFSPAVNAGRVAEMNAQSQRDRQSGQNAASAKEASEIYGSADSWATYESDKNKGERDNGQ